MLAIARALLTGPDLLLLDEPSQGLAPLVVNAVMSTIEELKKERVSMLLVEQNAEMALRLADRVYVIDHGTVVFEGTPSAFAPTHKSRGPTSASAVELLDDTVGAHQHRAGNLDAEGLSGAQVDDQLPLRGLFDRQITWSRALDDPVHEGADAAKVRRKIGAVAHQASVVGELARRKNAGSLALRQELDDAPAVTEQHAVADAYDGARPCARDGVESPVEILWTRHLE